jgi:hypothetical protein
MRAVLSCLRIRYDDLKRNFINPSETMCIVIHASNCHFQEGNVAGKACYREINTFQHMAQHDRQIIKIRDEDDRPWLHHQDISDPE